MKLEISTKQKREKEKRPKMRRRLSCPKCGSKNLLDVAPDQFCGDCDWDTCFEYVELGLMNNLEVAAWEHFGAEPKVAVACEKVGGELPPAPTDKNENDFERTA